MENNRKLVEQLGYEFRQPELLRNALTHSSSINEAHRQYYENNERLEFLIYFFFLIISQIFCSCNLFHPFITKYCQGLSNRTDNAIIVVAIIHIRKVEVDVDT